jgi:serine/threonine-protein kinase HipA
VFERIADGVRRWRECFVACGVSARDVEHVAPAMLPETFFLDRRPE